MYVFSKLRDPNEFREAHVSFDRVGWDHGVDLDADYVSRHREQKPGPRNG